MNKETETTKCVTEECENLTDMVVCDDCVDSLLPSYENQLERERGL